MPWVEQMLASYLSPDTASSLQAPTLPSKPLHTTSALVVCRTVMKIKMYACVLGSEGFNSGTHCWDVKVGDNTLWSVGITTASNQRKGDVFFNTNVWRVQYMDSEYGSKSLDQPYTGLTVKENLQRVRVHLDYDRGKVSFSDPLTNICLCTFTTTFTETVFPFLYNHCTTFPLRILPVKLIVTAENHS
ncbi:E3 ubiquitin-protein ligase TRIM39 [Labeo rohita]|uniref:E3 ubiquitin-protein ligase TRIM39 n=1 Tax=Labeo rohita TaxID=84645 RepID=A0ABQ8M2Y9_LABRO|nr:E3 ubiquitin-protein ligase TRIM39 [Labeo rohita]